MLKNHNLLGLAGDKPDQQETSDLWEIENAIFESLSTSCLWLVNLTLDEIYLRPAPRGSRPEILGLECQTVMATCLQLQPTAVPVPKVIGGWTVPPVVRVMLNTCGPPQLIPTKHKV